MTSPDGISWTTRTSAADNSWVGLTWSPALSLFCAVASSGTGNRVMTSPDGISWTTRTSAADNSWVDITWSPELSLFCVVSVTGTGNRVMTSPDGISWTTRTSAANNDWRGLTWSPELGVFCAIGGSGTGDRVMTNVPDLSSFNQNTTIGTRGVTTTTIDGNQLDIGQSSYQTNLGKYASEVNIGSLESSMNINGYNFQKCGLWCRKTEQQNNLASYSIIDFEFNTDSTNLSYSFGSDPPTIPDNDGVININRRGVYHITAGFTALDSTFADQSHMSIRILSGGVIYAYHRIRASGTKSQSMSVSGTLYFDVGDTFTIDGRSEAGTADINSVNLPATVSVILVSDLGGAITG
jgi:hypothetical protein